MGMNDFKKRKRCRPFPASSAFQLVGIILVAFGVTTLCAFLLPIKIWILFLGIVLLLCGCLLFCN